MDYQLDRVFALNVEGFDAAIDTHPFAAVHHLFRVVRIHLFHKEVRGVDHEIGESPGYVAIVTDDDEGQTGNRDADHIQLTGVHVHLIPDRGLTMAKMRIVGQNGVARGAMGRCDDPAVAGPGTGQDIQKILAALR